VSDVEKINRIIDLKKFFERSITSRYIDDNRLIRNFSCSYLILNRLTTLTNSN